jgi:hypothetical protein
MKTTRHLLILIIIASLLSACTSITATLSGKTAEELDEANLAEARYLLQTLENANSSLKTFKGIGKIKVWNNQQVQIDERLAWVGSDPLRIRIAVLVSGFPAVKLASDGQWFYYLETQGSSHVYKKIKASNANLERLIAIPIRSNDVITVLAGRIPLREHHSAYIKAAPSGDGYVLLLKRRWWGIIEKIYFDDTKTHVRQIEVFNRSGSLMYRVGFEDIREIQGYRVPFRLKISNDGGADCQLDIDRYWADVTISPSVFVLTPPE